MALVLALACVWPAGAAATGSEHFTVTTTADAHDAHPGNGVCADAAGACTLRAAVEEADALPAGTAVTVTVPAGTYTLTLGALAASRNTVTISGAGRASTVVTAQGHSQIIVVSAGATVGLDGLTLERGAAPGSTYGGAVLNAGTLTLAGSTVTDSTATAGGGLANAGGLLTLSASTVSGNVAAEYGGGGIQNGGVDNVPGRVVVASSVIEDNSSSDDGAGILNGANGHPSAPGQPALAPRRRTAGAPGRGGAASGLSLSVTASTLSGNEDGNAGGAIANEGGTTSIEDALITANAAPSGIGGAIYTYGSLTVTGSTLNGNRADYGGALETVTGGQASSAATVTTSTLDANTASFYGGAIDDGSTVTVQRSTMSANSAGDNGGAVEVEGATVAITNSTLTGNRGPSGSGAVASVSCGSGTLLFDTLDGRDGDLDLSCSTVTVTGTILAGSGANCSGSPPAESTGYNLDSGASCGLSEPTDLTGVDPDLAGLAENGGPTATQALAAGSPAINAGGQHSTGCPATDQRGVVRPQGPACDIGAFEAMAS